MNTKYKIAICFDGTWNTVECPGKYSNVKKLKDRIVKKNSEEDVLFLTQYLQQDPKMVGITDETENAQYFQHPCDSEQFERVVEKAE